MSADHGFDRVFAPGLQFYLEPLRSGWIVRVLSANAPRGAHDRAELATPPYQSVSPLLISTDWAFRAQDAVGWNPRHFRYAGTASASAALEWLQPLALAGDAGAEAKLATLVSAQPEGTLEVLNARFAPGIADQAKMASAVALHLTSTPHEVDTSLAPSALGRLEVIHFRVLLSLPAGVHANRGVSEREGPCAEEPTSLPAAASQQSQRTKPK